MESLFYFSKNAVQLAELVNTFARAGLVSSHWSFGPHRIIVYHDNLFFHVIDLDALPAPFEEAQEEVLREYGPRTSVQLLFPAAHLPQLRKHLRVLLEQHGGWIGLDDGEFAVRYEMANLDELTLSVDEPAERPRPMRKSS